MKTQFEVRGWIKFAEEDIFSEGCLPNTAIHDSGNDFFKADSSPEIVEKLKQFANGDNDSVMIDSCEEPGRIDISVMEDANGDKASEKELSLWKEGKKRLWNAIYSFQVEKVRREEFAFNTPSKAEKGFSKIPVRFFMWDTDSDNGQGDFVECDEYDFLAADGVIKYERNTIFENGVNQIYLTKNPFHNC